VKNTRRLRLPVLITVVFCLIGGNGYGQNAAHRTDDLLFKVAVFGPSDDIFIWWGHAALIVENTRWQYARVFDWGIFSYPGDNFLNDFLHGRIRYKSDVGTLDFDEYIEEDRDILIYTLDLDRDAKTVILEYAENNVLPENCYYDYHEFRDNCATRIRDIVDMGTNGQFRKLYTDSQNTERARGRYTRRQHIRRFSWSHPFADWVLDFIMGRDLDQPLSAWEEMFLPVELGRNIVDFSYIDSSGTERKLVSGVELRNATKNRPPVLQKPPQPWPVHLLLSAVTAVLLAFIKILRERMPRTGRIAWGLSQSLLGLVFGSAGCVLAFGWFAMDNDYIQQNINILFINPLLLAALPLGILTALGRPKSERCLYILWTAVSIAGFFALALNALSSLRQQNQSALAVILPIALVLSLIPTLVGQKLLRPAR
jgi:hypothetical protein